MTGQSLLEDDHESVGRLLGELRTTLRAGADAGAAYRLLDEVWARPLAEVRHELMNLPPRLSRRGCSP